MNWGAKNRPFYAFIIAFFIVMIAPYLLSHGMFMDGIMYATVSNNLANGLGSMSDLAFSETIELHFREHPPLAFWIQSMFYKIFGDSYVIEKLYSALTYIITGLIIRKIWIKITHQKELAWLPLLFWVSIPIITQAARNNLLENTMMIFTTGALYFLIDTKKQATKKVIISGFLIYLGFMTKGFVALFLWSFPFWFFIIKREITFLESIKQTSLLILFTILPFVFVSVLYPSSFQYMLDYFNVQVANSLQNVQTVESRFWIIGKLLKELITPGILLVITLLISVLAPSSSTVAPHKKMAFVLLFLALSGVLPIIISLKQSGFYFIPALGIFSLSFALLIYHKVDKLYQKINTKHLAFKLFKVITFSGVLIGFFIIIMNAGTDGRDHEKLSDIRLIKNKLAKNRILEANSHVKQDWTSLSYFYRYYKISIELTDTPSKQFYLTLKSLDIRQSEYQASELELFYFKLYEHN